MAAKSEFQPCQKDSGEMHSQRRMGFVKYKDQKYSVFRCYCAARPYPHLNRIIVFSAASVDRRPENRVSGAWTGRSIFGQTLRRGGV